MTTPSSTTGVTENGQSRTVVVCALYHFARIDDPEELRSRLLALLTQHNVKGTLLVAAEGINGTVAGTRVGIDALKSRVSEDGRFEGISYKESVSDDMPFLRTRVKLKKEIVTMGVPDIDPMQIVGTYVKPEAWNALITEPDVLLIDTRNEYEVGIGTFQGAVNPHTTSFREFPDYVREQLDPKKKQKVAMFCTGGIRCEKSTAFLKAEGFDEVYHLEGGILKYLEEVPEEESLWEGECFVFDERVTVDHNLAPGSYDQCHACRMPITSEDKSLGSYARGISCLHCIDKKSDADRERFSERQRQMRLAEARGDSHMGSDAQFSQKKRAEEKKARRESQRTAEQKPTPQTK